MGYLAPLKAQQSRTILFVYRSPDRATARALEERGLRPCLALSRAEAIARAAESAPRCAVVDLLVPEPGALEIVSELKAVAADARIVLTTSFGSVFTAVEAMRRGAADYLLKPVAGTQLLAAIGASTAGASSSEHAFLTLERMQWEYIHTVLDGCGRNVSEAARRLGLHRQSLQRMLRRHPPLR
jgi:two-component system response regulator RegA